MLHEDPHVVYVHLKARDALKSLDALDVRSSKTLFVLDNDQHLVGALTDGDIRRGLINGLEIFDPVEKFMNSHFKYLKKTSNNLKQIADYKSQQIYVIPLVDDDHRIIEILDLKNVKTLLPLSALILAGGRGERLMPLTNAQPKPMLQVGGVPIIEHNINRLINYGIKDIYISVKYLKEQIIDYFGDGKSRGVSIRYIEESTPLGTLGSLSLIDDIPFDDILVMNSDLLTNIDFEDFYNYYKDHKATMALASIPYQVNIPYAVLETNNHQVMAFKEKPSYTYYSNGGIYLMRFDKKDAFEKGCFFNATDLMDVIIADKKETLVHYPLVSYWLDIGNHQDYAKAQEDIKHLQF